MKKMIPTAALLLGTFPLLLASINPAAQQLLITAKQQASIFHDGASPLQLDVDFLAQMNVAAHGHLTLKWAAKDRWWRRIVMGNFEQIEVRKGDRLYTSRNMAFTPVRIRELISLLQFAEDSEGLESKKQKQRVEDGVELTCLQVREENARGRWHEVCLNPASRDIVSDVWQEPPEERREQQYSNYFDFEGHRYPQKFHLVVNGSKVITAKVDNLMGAPFDPELLIVPEGAIERRQCAGMKHAVPVNTPDPAYPKSASRNKLMGDTTVAMTVLTDGSVTDIQLVGSSAHSMDDATSQTLKSWKFKPAMCGAEPVVSDIVVVVSFRLR
jgi:TonB family protein